MRCSSSVQLRSPKKEEQEVPDAIISSYHDEEFNIYEELKGVLNSTTKVEEEEEQEQDSLPQQNSSSGEYFHWDFMEWEEEFRAPNVGDEEDIIIKRETNFFGFWDLDGEKMLSLNLNLNYQDVLDAWSDRGSLWADDCSLSFSTNDTYYMGEVPVLEEERARREASVLRYKEKRQNRLFSKKIRYQVRKLNADKRPRIKGRFVKRQY